jgi:acetyl-CoA carboxylase carboxyl transferase subunit beta
LVQISGKIIDADELERNLFVSPEDGFHVRIGSSTYFEILFDNNVVELDKT